MTNYRTDIQEMLDIEKARRNDPANQFGFTKVEITDVIVDFVRKNSRCEKAVNGRTFRASQFIRFDGKELVFKREQDDEETSVKRSWIRNIDDVIRFIKK